MTRSSGAHRSDEQNTAAGRHSRRKILKIGLGVAMGAGVVGTGTAIAGTGNPGDPTIPTIATKIKNLSGPAETGRFGSPWTDLGIPVRCPDGTMLFVGGDTFAGDHVPGEGEVDPDWRCPVGLRSGSSDLNNLNIDGCVGGGHARSLVDEPHNPVPGGATTAIPSDVFVVDGVMYMHLMRGKIFDTHHTDFWRSFDNGETWEYLCQWPGDLHGGQFQQKTYAVADDGFCYVFSSVFNRDVPTGLLLHRVRKDELGNPDAYEPWGYADGGWDWRKPPTTVLPPRRLGEICFRAIDGKYLLTWLNLEPTQIRGMVVPLPTSDLTATPEHTIIVHGSPEAHNVVTAPYGGWIIPGSTFGDLHMVVSQWYDPHNYRFMQYKVNMTS